MRILVVLLIICNVVLGAQEEHPLCGDNHKSIRNYLCAMDPQKTSEEGKKDLNQECIPAAYKNYQSLVNRVKKSTGDFDDKISCYMDMGTLAEKIVNDSANEKDASNKDKEYNKLDNPCFQFGCDQINYLKNLTSVIPVFSLMGAMGSSFKMIPEQIQKSLNSQTYLPSIEKGQEACEECLSQKTKDYYPNGNNEEADLSDLNDYIYEGLRKNIVDRYLLKLQDRYLTDSDDSNDCLTSKDVDSFLSAKEKRKVKELTDDGENYIYSCPENSRKISLKEYKQYNSALIRRDKSHLDHLVILLKKFQGLTLTERVKEILFNKAGKDLKASEILYQGVNKQFLTTIDSGAMNLAPVDKASLDDYLKRAKELYDQNYTKAKVSELLGAAVEEEPNFRYFLNSSYSFLANSKNNEQVFELYKKINSKNNKSTISDSLKDSMGSYCEEVSKDLDRIKGLKNSGKGFLKKDETGNYQIASGSLDSADKKILSLALDSYQRIKKKENTESNYKAMGLLKCRYGESYTKLSPSSYPFASGFEDSHSLPLVGSIESGRVAKSSFFNDYCREPERVIAEAKRIRELNNRWKQNHCIGNKCSQEATKKIKENPNKYKVANNTSRNIAESKKSKVSRVSDTITSQSSGNQVTPQRVRGIASSQSFIEKQHVSSKPEAVSGNSTRGKKAEELNAGRKDARVAKNSTSSTNSRKLQELEKQNQALEKQLNRLESDRKAASSTAAVAAKQNFSNNGRLAQSSQSDNGRDFMNKRTSEIGSYAKATVGDALSAQRSLAKIRGNISQDKLDGVVSLKVNSIINPSSSLDEIYESLQDYDLAIIKEALNAKMPVEFVSSTGRVIRTIEIDTPEYKLLIDKFQEVTNIAAIEKPLNNTRLEYLNLIKATEELQSK